MANVAEIYDGDVRNCQGINSNKYRVLRDKGPPRLLRYPYLTRVLFVFRN